MKGSKYLRAELCDAESICQLSLASIRGLTGKHYSAERIERWADRGIEKFAQDIQKESVLVCELEGRIIGYGQIDMENAAIPTIYVHPDFVRRHVSPFLLCFLESKATSGDGLSVRVNATLCAVEFFRAQGNAELGSVAEPLLDGSTIAGVRMEHILVEKIEFAPSDGARRGGEIHSTRNL